MMLIHQSSALNWCMSSFGQVQWDRKEHASLVVTLPLLMWAVRLRTDFPSGCFTNLCTAKWRATCKPLLSSSTGLVLGTGSSLCLWQRIWCWAMLSQLICRDIILYNSPSGNTAHHLCFCHITKLGVKGRGNLYIISNLTTNLELSKHQ